MGAKREIDWDAIRLLYRTDQLSTREIARRYGVTETAIRLKAKAQNWSKDLAAQVATGVKEAVIRGQFAIAPLHLRSKKAREATEREVIAAAVEEGRQVVIKHQELGKLLRGNTLRLAEEIDRRMETVSELDAKALAFLSRAHESLTRAAVNAIEIERKARGLDDMLVDPNAPPSISITFYRSDKVLPNQIGPAATPAIDIVSKPD
jgi:hypothetical protein